MTIPPQASLAVPARYPVSGWIEALLFVFAIAVLSVSYVVGQGFGAHPIALILTSMIMSSIVLLAVAGPGPDALRIVRAPLSLLVGSGFILMEVFYFMLLEHASPALGSLLVRLAIPISMAVGWLLVARRPPWLALVGGGVVVAALAPLALDIAPGHRLAALGAAVGSASAFCLRTFATEFHPWNRRAKTVIEKLRITGLVVLVTSAAGLALTVGFSALIAWGWLAPLPMVPTAGQLLHPPTLLLGLFMGSTVLTSMAFLSFSSVVKITSENFTAIGAFTPAATLIVQSAAGLTGLIPLFPVETTLVPSMAVVVAGVFLILYAARRR